MTKELDTFEKYLIEEFYNDFREGEISRRTFIRRVAFITGSMAATVAAMSAVGCLPVELPAATDAMPEPVTPTTMAEEEVVTGALVPVEGARLGMTGYCFGGITWRIATAMPDLNAAVPFYGPAPDLDQVPNIQAPMLDVYAEQDERINANIDALDAALSAVGITYEMNIYPGVNDAFHNDTGRRYVEEQTTQAWQDMRAWFAEYRLPLPVLLFVCILLTACVNVVESEVGIAPTVDQQNLAQEDDATEENETTAGNGSTDDSTAIADTLIQLSDPLDEPEYYCIDVPGFGQSLNLDGALTAHTCKPNSDDELFTINYPAEGQFYMPAYERCMEARTAEAGAELTMTACSDSPLQQFTHHDDGSIQLQSSDSETLCIAVADEAGEPTGGPSHLMRDLLLQPCATVSTALSQWVFPGREVK